MCGKKSQSSKTVSFNSTEQTQRVDGLLKRFPKLIFRGLTGTRRVWKPCPRTVMRQSQVCSRSVPLVHSPLYQGVCPRPVRRSGPVPVRGRLARRRLFQRYESALFFPSSNSQTSPHPLLPAFSFPVGLCFLEKHKLHNRK